MFDLALPLFIADCDGVDVSGYRSVSDAESDLEATDVENNEYKAFDAEGRLLHLTVEYGLVRIASAESKPCHAAELRGRLEKFLRAKEAVTVPETASLAEIVEIARRSTLES